METILAAAKAVLGMFVVMAVWLAIQGFVRWRSGCGHDKDVLDFMLHGCGGCSGRGQCHKRHEERNHHHEPA